MTISATSLTNMYSNTGSTVTGAKTDSSKNFTTVMGNVTNGSNKSDGKQQNTGKTENSSVSKRDQTGIKTERPQKTVNDVAVKDTDHQVSTAKDMDVTDDVLDKVNEKTDEMIAAIADLMGVSQEEIEKAMETLGMTNVDLLNPDMLSQLVVQISGEEDMMSLVMDEDLYGKLNSLLETADEIKTQLSQELNIPSEELPKFLEQVNSVNNTDLPKDSAVTEDIPSVESTEQLPEMEPDSRSASETQKVIVEVDNKVSAKESVSTQSTDSAPEMKETIEKPLESTPSQEGARNNNPERGYQENGNSFLQNLTETAAALAEKANGEVQNTSFSSAMPTQEPESIMRQMIDYMRLHVTSDVSEMEIQLQPANLGTVNLNIASRNGAITAQFTAQNETVKEALETQIVQLRENLDERGIKVDAIEVTVASHEFERNLEQGQQDARDSERAEATRKTGRRRIVLNEAGTEDSEAMDVDTMDEADRIEAALMQQRGNTVSLQA